MYYLVKEWRQIESNDILKTRHIGERINLEWNNWAKKETTTLSFDPRRATITKLKPVPWSIREGTEHDDQRTIVQQGSTKEHISVIVIIAAANAELATVGRN